MAVTKDDICDWIKKASDEDEYMIVHSDGFSYEYYPTFHESHKEAQEKLEESRSENMHSVREVYDLTADDLDWQVEKNRAFEI